MRKEGLYKRFPREQQIFRVTVNDYFGHLGGVSECSKRDADNDGGDFDE